MKKKTLLAVFNKINLINKTKYPMKPIIKYLEKHINIRTIICTKSHGAICGIITSIDKHCNISIDRPELPSGEVKDKMFLRGSEIRYIYLN